MEHHSISLMLRDPAWACEFSKVHDVVILASPCSISFYSLEEGGMPRKALYYDFHCPAIEFKVQQSQKALMAAIYDTQILFWDPCHHPQPISYVRNGICLRNFHWSDDNEHTFCSSSSNNTVQIWDVRSPARPAKELVVGRRIEKLATCPANSHLIAANVENKAVVVWDSRMLSSTEAVSNEDSYCILDVPSPHAGQRNSGTKRFGLEQLPMSFNMALPLAEASVSDLSWYWRDGRCRLRVLQGSGSCSDTFISSGEGGKVVDSSWQPIGQYPELDKDFRMMDARFLQEDDAVVLFKQDYTGRRCRMYYMVEERSEAGKTGQENPSNNSNSSSSLCTSLIEAVSFRHRLLSCFYRNKKLLAVTEDGTLHSLAGVDKGSKPATSRDDLLFSSQIDAYQRRKRNSFPSLKSFLVSPEGQLDMRNLDSRRASKIISTERSGVVGPITFMHSMQEELIAIESGISNRHLEGVRIDAVDQFVRQLVLEVLLPRKERFAMAKKTYSTGSSNYYDSIELDNFSSASMSLAGRSIALIISFPAKVASFWHLKFFLENRSRTEFDEQDFTALTEELAVLAKNKAQAKAAVQPTNSTHQGKHPYNRSFHGQVDVDNTVLYHVAKLFKRRILKLWEKIIEQEQAHVGLSQSSFKHSVAMSFASEAEKDIENCEAKYFPYVEPRAFTVPFPRLSGAVFNSNGEMMLYGNAELFLPGDNSVFKSQCGYVNNLPDWVQHYAHSVKRTVEDNSVSASYLHRSYAYTRCLNYVKKSNSDLRVAGNASPSALSDDSHEIFGERKLAENTIKDSSVAKQSCRENKLKALLSSPSEENNLDSKHLNSDENGDHEENEENEEHAEHGDHEAQFSMEMDIEPKLSPLVSFPTSPRSDKKNNSTIDEMQVTSVTFMSPAKIKSGGAQSASSVVIPTIPLSQLLSPDHKAANGSRENLSVNSSSYYIGEDASSRREASVDSTTSTSKVAERDALDSVAVKTDGLPSILVLTPPLFPVFSSLIPKLSLGPCAIRDNGRKLIQERVDCCRANAQLMEELFPNRRSWAQIWSLLAVSLEVYNLADNGGFMSWQRSSLGRNLVDKVLQHLVAVNNLQMWAAVICLLGGSKKVSTMISPSVFPVVVPGSAQEPASLKLMEAALDCKIDAYWNILSRWGYGYLAVEVAKARSSVVFQWRDTLDVLGVTVESPESAESDEDDEDDVMQCSVCHDKVLSLYLPCGICGHGGHVQHLANWFTMQEECAAGCGCHCVTNMRYGEHQNVAFDYSDNVAESPEVQVHSNHGFYSIDLGGTKQSYSKTALFYSPSSSYLMDVSMEQTSKYNLFNQQVTYDDDFGYDNDNYYDDDEAEGEM